ncbi:MAG: cation diffusion facilitator family transporter [Bacilli bacterium]|nr:cation diffusion facilitator family transporter [Bacilli bacterium]
MKNVVQSMIVSIVVNFILIVIKLVVGIISNYKSLVADAIHSFSDMSTDLVAIFGQWLAVKKADDKHPYGHGKIEYITSIIIGGFILALGIGLINSTITGNIAPSKYTNIALIVVIITIILKYGLAKYVYYKGKIDNNSILLASAQENMADVLSSIGVFITITLSLLTKYVPIFKYADKVGGLIISLLIIKTSFNILRDNINAIIGEREQNQNVIDKIKNIILSISDVLSIDDLVVMKLGSYYQIILDVGLDAKMTLKDAHNVAHKIEKELIDSNLKIKYVTVHINPSAKSIS